MKKKLNKVPSVGTKVDSEQNADSISVSQHRSKPNVEPTPTVKGAT